MQAVPVQAVCRVGLGVSVSVGWVAVGFGGGQGTTGLKHPKAWTAAETGQWMVKKGFMVAPLNIDPA